MAGRDSSDLQEVAAESGFGMSSPGKQSLTWVSLLVRTYGLYRDRFRSLFLIALPPAVLAYLSTFLLRAFFRIALARIWDLLPWRSPGYWAIILATILFEGAVYWLISGFFFAGVASSVLGETGNNETLLSDAFSRARARLGALAAITLITWAAFATGQGIISLAIAPLLGTRYPMLVQVVFDVMLLMLCGLLSRLGLAIPILMDDPQASARQSLRLSLIRTENWEPFFMLFLAKSAVIGYAAYWTVNFGLHYLFNRGMLPPEAFPWVQALFYICLAAMLESPLFIAFSLLYHESKALPQEAAAAAPLS